MAHRSEKIRTYNFPQNLVTDHRTNLTIQNLPAIMEGDLEDLITALMTGDLAKRLSELAVASFLKERSDSLEFVPQSGDKPLDFKITVGSRTAFVETELLEHNSKITQKLELF